MRKVLLAGAAAVGVAAATVLTATASATSAGEAPLRLTAKAAAVAVITPCRTCLKSVPPGIHMGAVADESGKLLGEHGATVGHFAITATQVTPVAAGAPGELLLDVTLVLSAGQITAHGIEEPPDTAGTIAITGGTGAYRSARGQIRFRDTRPGTTLLQVAIERSPES
jgi:hypothetical protein